MTTSLAICAGIALSATVYQLMKAQLKAAQADFNHLEAQRKETAALLLQSGNDLKKIKEDLVISDNANELLQKQVDFLTAQIEATKVTRDPKTGRMVSAKRK